MNSSLTPRFCSTLLIASSVTLGSGLSVASTERMDPVVVTATRTAVTVDDSVSTVKVFDQEYIEQSQAGSVEELLQGHAGMHFTNNGGRGKSTSLFLRGTNSDHVVVLIDGVKVGSATLGSVPFQDIPLGQIERIEVVRGARSSLYGSEAMGGVIQIFTRKGQQEGRSFASATVGSQDTFEGTVGHSGAKGALFYNLSASGAHTTGFDSCQAEADGVGACFNDEPDKDGYENFSGNVRLGYGFSGGSEVSVLAMETNADNYFDGNFQNSSETRQRVFGLNSDMVLTNNYLLKLQAGRSTDQSDNFIDEALTTHFNTLRDTVSLQNDLALGEHYLLTFGGDYQRDEVDSSTDYAVKERENVGGFLQAQVEAGSLNLELSGRHDDNDVYGSNTTFGLGLAYRLAEGLRVVASHGTAFKAPTFNQLYFPFFGSTDLKPEESRSSELGLRARTEKQQWGITLFKTVIDDLIVYDSDIFAANNLDKAVIKGVELELNHRFNRQWQTTLDLTLMRPENDSDNANKGNVLARRPERSGRVDLSYSHQDWRLAGTVHIVGSRYDNVSNSRKLSAYRTLDLHLAKALNPDWTIQAKIENVSDTDYQTASFYNQQERSVFLTVRYQPQ